MRRIVFGMTKPHTPQSQAGAEAELVVAPRARREADWALPMSERLARLHELCKQIGAVKGSARSR